MQNVNEEKDLSTESGQVSASRSGQASDVTKYTYKWLDPNSYDPDTTPHFKRKIRFTRGSFVGWTEPMGIANVPYAIFKTRSTEILIPRYDLTAESLAKLAEVS